MSDFNTYDFIKNYEPTYTPAAFQELLTKHRLKGQRKEDFFNTAIRESFQTLLGRQPGAQEQQDVYDYLDLINAKTPAEITSSVTSQLSMRPESVQYLETTGPMTDEETKMAAYYGRPIRDEAGAKTGRYGSIISPIGYQMG